MRHTGCFGRITSVILLILSSINAYSQSDLPSILYHQPQMTHYTKEAIQADTQFWTACRDSNGTTYFGNNDGLIIFDGERWEKLHLPNNSSVRSLLHASDGKIYAGGYNELGTIQKDSFGIYHYRSLIDKFGLKNNNLENLWQSHELSGTIIFRAFNELIVIHQNQPTHIAATNTFIYSNAVHNVYYVQDDKLGILAYHPETSALTTVFPALEFQNQNISGILPTANDHELLIITKTGHIYKGDTKTQKLTTLGQLFENEDHDQVISAIEKDNYYLIGTLSSKVKLLNYNGELVNTASMFNQIQNTTVLNFLKADNNIWILLNNGLVYLNFDSPVLRIFDEASIYDIKIHDSHLYLATNTGVYYSPFDNASLNFQFKKIESLEGQAWSLSVINNTLFASHDKGLFLIDKNHGISQIGTINGIWKLITIPNKPNRYIACGYNGLYVIDKLGNDYELSHKIKGFNESSRDIMPAEEPNTFWICHGFKGVFKIRINNDYTQVYATDHYTTQNGFQSAFNINVFKWKNDIVFTTNTGIYQFDNTSKIFKPYEPLNMILDTSKNIRKILEHGQTTWVVQDNEIGYFFADEAQPEVHKKLFGNVKDYLNRSMESILPVHNQVYVGTTEGVYLYNLKKQHTTKAETILSKVSLVQNLKKTALPVSSPDYLVKLPNQTDIIRFDFAAPQLGLSNTKEYQYILEDVDAGWSVWQTSAYKEYTHLRPGNYTFKVRSRNPIGETGETAVYSFSIAYKWHQTLFAKIIYSAVFLMLLWLLYHFVAKRIETQSRKARIEALKTQRLLKLEIEQLKLEQDKEKVEKDNLLLEQELANYTLQLVNKKEIFDELLNDLKELRAIVKTQSSKSKLSNIFTKVRQHKISEEYLEVFDVNFEKIHHQFFEKLRTIDPTISKRDLRLCAFIKMDLPNKEISPLLSISVRGIETARFRIRKKLGLSAQDNLHDFLKKL